MRNTVHQEAEKPKPDGSFEDLRDKVGGRFETVARKDDDFNGVQNNAEGGDAHHQDGGPCWCQFWMFEGVAEVVYLPRPAAVGAENDIR